MLEIKQDKSIAWQLVSNAFHKDRDIPQVQEVGGEEPRNITEEELSAALDIIHDDIPDFDYTTVYSRVKDRAEMIRVYRNSNSGFEKVQIYRILCDGELETGSALKKYVDETFHVQNDYLFQLNPREYKIVPQYIIDCCDNTIDIIEAGLT